MRSRHCKDEPAFKNVTGEIWEGESKVMSPSQENCLFDNHRYVPTSDRKGIEVCWFQCFLAYFSTRNLTCHFWVARFLLPLKVTVEHIHQASLLLNWWTQIWGWCDPWIGKLWWCISITFVGMVRCFSVWFRVEKEAHICLTKRLQRMLNAIY